MASSHFTSHSHRPSRGSRSPRRATGIDRWPRPRRGCERPRTRKRGGGAGRGSRSRAPGADHDQNHAPGEEEQADDQRPIQSQSKKFASAPALTSAVTPRDAFAFMTTIVQSPDSACQLAL